MHTLRNTDRLYDTDPYVPGTEKKERHRHLLVESAWNDVKIKIGKMFNTLWRIKITKIQGQDFKGKIKN